jgi:hypothetical protein
LQGDKFFVEAKLKDEETPKDKLLSIQDICVDKNLYTLPYIDGEEKYSLEKYYAENIDRVYPEVYEILTDPRKTYITTEQRAQIVMTTMSLFFRTPKFLNFNEHRTNLIIEYGVNNHMDDNGIVRFKFKDNYFNFHIDNIEEVKANLKIKNKLKFLKEHLDAWHKFIQFKIKAGLSVFRIYEDFDLITSDNPVIMHSVVGNSFNVFDPTNIISLPLDNKHFLTIFPNTESAMLDRIFRGDRDKWFGLTSNLDVERNSEEWIIGKPNSVRKHLTDQVKYGEHNKDNLQALEEMKQRAFDIKDLMDIVEQVGTFAHQRVADKVKELRKKKIHQDDPEMRKIILELARHGFLTI